MWFGQSCRDFSFVVIYAIFPPNPNFQIFRIEEKKLLIATLPTRLPHIVSWCSAMQSGFIHNHVLLNLHHLLVPLFHLLLQECWQKPTWEQKICPKEPEEIYACAKSGWPIYICQYTIYLQGSAKAAVMIKCWWNTNSNISNYITDICTEMSCTHSAVGKIVRCHHESWYESVQHNC